MWNPLRFFVLGLALVSCLACQSEDQQAASKRTVTDLPEAPEARAVAAKDALFKKLSARLVQTMTGRGLAGAIEVCREEAPEIAKQIAQEYQVKIGRTSMRLRNPENQPPDWAISLLKESPQEPQFTDLANGGLGAIYPIVLQERCVMCHGPAEQLAPDVKEKLATLYPNDQATGFQEGDLRGWFWVEVPETQQ